MNALCHFMLLVSQCHIYSSPFYIIIANAEKSNILSINLKKKYGHGGMWSCKTVVCVPRNYFPSIEFLAVINSYCMLEQNVHWTFSIGSYIAI